MKSAPEASVVIPHYRDACRLDRCLMSLGQSVGRALVEIIVVDNGPRTLGASFVGRHPNVRFFHESRQGAAHARNTGVASAKGPILIFTDSDCIVGPEFLERAIKAGLTHDIIGGAITLSSPIEGQKNGIQAFEHVFAFNQQEYVAKKGFSVTANLVTTRAVFAKTGPFQTGVSEDLDWCHRAIKLGFKLVFEPGLGVFHPARETWPQLRDKWRRITSESYGVHCAAAAPDVMWYLRAALMPVSIAYHIPRILVSSSLSSPQERWGGIVILARLRLWRAAEMVRVAVGCAAETCRPDGPVVEDPRHSP